MCGRYHLDLSDKKAFAKRFELDEDLVSPYETKYNMAPGQALPVIIKEEKNKLEKMVWGIIPSWEKSVNPTGMINARAETVASRPYFKEAFSTSRCLIPASGFYEWSKNKQPFYIKEKEINYFGFAGLYSVWTHPKTGEKLKTYTIVTVPANEQISPIHNRMPVILEKESEELWLDPTYTQLEKLAPLLWGKTKKLDIWPISKLINSPKNDSPKCIQPLCA